MYRVSSFVPRFARALLGGAVVATLWVNVDPASYYDAIEWRIADLPLPPWLAANPVSLTPLRLVVDGLMAFFFLILGKELWESLVLDRGALRGPRAILPLGLMLGGMLGAAGVWLLVAGLIGTVEGEPFTQGWQVPLGSDVVLCFLIGRRVFGPGHPALHLLLILGIATDILALLVLGLTHPLSDLRPVWLLLPLAAALTVWATLGRNPATDLSERSRRARQVLWPYGIAALLCWLGVTASGLPPVLGLLPILPAIAHADRSFGLFAEVEELLHDPLNRLAHLLVWPLTVVLFAFGLTCGGVDLAAFGPVTLTVLASLWIGRPLGMALIGLGLAAGLGVRLPAGVTLRDILMITAIMAMGFTVPILALQSTLPGGLMAEAARLGLAISLLAGPALLLLRRSLWAGQAV